MSARQASADDVLGMAWFNGLTEARRAYWLNLAKSSRPVDAWQTYQRMRGVLGELLDH